MAQSNALREQPSMDEILASIRRIIDAGETQLTGNAPPKAPRVEPAVVQATVPPAPANDAGKTRPPAPVAGLTQQAPSTVRAASVERPAAPKAAPAIKAAVSDYLEKERVKEASAAPAAKPKDVEITLEAGPDPDVSEVEEALRAEFAPADRKVLSAERDAKYGARFTEADNGAFQQVGSLLRGKVEGSVTIEPAAERSANALVSDAVSQSVSHSFSSLSDVLSEKHGRDLDTVAEDMLRPMLQEWLDNNLPSLVERLVRGEIERIARGEPRTA